MLPNMNPETGVRYGVIKFSTLTFDAQDTILGEGTDLSYAAALAEARADIERTYDRELSEADMAAVDEAVEARMEDWETDEPSIAYSSSPDDGDPLDVCTFWLGGALLVLVTLSPHTTRRPLCSPCVPGAGNLDDDEAPNGEIAYDVPPEWRRNE